MADLSPQRQHLRSALALHGVLAAEGGNSCFSPYSIDSALGMTFQAARGTTADQVCALLNAGEVDIVKQVELLRDAATLAVERGGEAPVLAVSNTLWAWDELPLNPDFQAELAGWPGAKMATAPFVTDPEAARGAINADVAETTRDLIKELVPPGAITVDTVASLVNALYLKTSWREPFYEHSTEDAEFRTPAGPRRVPMMRQVERLGFAAAGGWRAVALPAACGVEAVALLPDAELAEAEPGMDAELLDALLSSASKRRVALSLPKLDIDMQASLTAGLGALGVTQLFTPAADLGGLSDDPRLMVSDALHEAVLRVDEEGLEGAAATAMMIRMTSMDLSEPVEVRLDRPFLLLVRHAATGAVYFMARVTDPS
ncbi:MAG: serpin family protein [Actinophytocola sp.]|nr:serpin family protein [Actinophytocola sp.]